VNDISIIYNGKATNIDNMLSEFNVVSPKIKYTIVLEENYKINFLDITVTKSQNSIETATDRKLTTIDCIIPHDSCHLTRCKISGIRYLVLYFGWTDIVVLDRNTIMCLLSLELELKFSTSFYISQQERRHFSNFSYLE